MGRFQGVRVIYGGRLVGLRHRHQTVPSLSCSRAAPPAPNNSSCCSSSCYCCCWSPAVPRYHTGTSEGGTAPPTGGKAGSRGVVGVEAASSRGATGGLSACDDGSVPLLQHDSPEHRRTSLAFPSLLLYPASS